MALTPQEILGFLTPAPPVGTGARTLQQGLSGVREAQRMKEAKRRSLEMEEMARRAQDEVERAKKEEEELKRQKALIEAEKNYRDQELKAQDLVFQGVKEIDPTADPQKAQMLMSAVGAQVTPQPARMPPPGAPPLTPPMAAAPVEEPPVAPGVPPTAEPLPGDPPYRFADVASQIEGAEPPRAPLEIPPEQSPQPPPPDAEPQALPGRPEELKRFEVAIGDNIYRVDPGARREKATKDVVDMFAANLKMSSIQDRNAAAQALAVAPFALEFHKFDRDKALEEVWENYRHRIGQEHSDLRAQEVRLAMERSKGRGEGRYERKEARQAVMDVLKMYDTQKNVERVRTANDGLEYFDKKNGVLDNVGIKMIIRSTGEHRISDQDFKLGFGPDSILGQIKKIAKIHWENPLDAHYPDHLRVRFTQAVLAMKKRAMMSIMDARKNVVGLYHSEPSLQGRSTIGRMLNWIPNYGEKEELNIPVDSQGRPLITVYLQEKAAVQTKGLGSDVATNELSEMLDGVEERE